MNQSSSLPSHNDQILKQSLPGTTGSPNEVELITKPAFRFTVGGTRSVEGVEKPSMISLDVNGVGYVFIVFVFFFFILPSTKRSTINKELLAEIKGLRNDVARLLKEVEKVVN